MNGHSKTRTAFIRSLMKKFNLSGKAIFLMGVEALMQIERDINDVISFGQYVKGYYYPGAKVVRKEMRGNSVFDYIYIYNIFFSKGKYIVVYKDNYDKDDFNLKTVKVGRVDEEILSEFTIDKGMIPE